MEIFTGIKLFFINIRKSENPLVFILSLFVGVFIIAFLVEVLKTPVWGVVIFWGSLPAFVIVSLILGALGDKIQGIINKRLCDDIIKRTEGLDLVQLNEDLSDFGKYTLAALANFGIKYNLTGSGRDYRLDTVYSIEYDEYRNYLTIRLLSGVRGNIKEEYRILIDLWICRIRSKRVGCLYLMDLIGGGVCESRGIDDTQDIYYKIIEDMRGYSVWA